LYEVQVSDVEERTETSVDLGRRAARHAESRMLPLEVVDQLGGVAQANRRAASRVERTVSSSPGSRPRRSIPRWKAIEDGVNELGYIDVVVANADICAMGTGQTLQSWSDTIDTDLVGVFNAIQASLPHVNDGASIIATGSLAAQLGSATNQGHAAPYAGHADSLDRTAGRIEHRGLPCRRRFPLHHWHPIAGGRRRIRQGEAVEGLIRWAALSRMLSRM
jgi:NAD(P)-dependent dehydrogenase (short-subunit alcohol dehydrogenase family)